MRAPFITASSTATPLAALAFAFVAAAVLPPSAAAQTYRWTDSAGRTIISDTAPPGKSGAAKAAEAPAPTPTDNLPFATRRAMDIYPVTLYTSADCTTECARGRELLNSRGIPFKEVMLQNSEDIETLKKLVGEAVVPSLQVGKQSYKGILDSAWHNLLDLAGYPKTAPYGYKPASALPQ